MPAIQTLRLKGDWKAIKKLLEEIDSLAKTLKVQVKYEIESPKPSIYQCLIDGEIFDTRTGKGKMHMATKHGLNLQGALRQGKVKLIEEGKTHV